jgi:3-hydroxyisobutyrate dehydrogenase-like beta-hydroxyacid dehydrogenase
LAAAAAGAQSADCCPLTVLLLQCDQLVAEGAIAAATPAEVVQQCDITFAMLADPEAAIKV